MPQGPFKLLEIRGDNKEIPKEGELQQKIRMMLMLGMMVTNSNVLHELETFMVE